MVKIALENESARIVDIALCEFKCLKALFSGLVRNDHKLVKALFADTMRKLSGHRLSFLGLCCLLCSLSSHLDRL